MTKVYLLAPLAGMLVFSGVYTHYHRDYTARIAETQQQATAAQTAKAAATETAKLKAVELGRITQAKRNEEREEKARIEETQRQARATLEALRVALAEQTGRLRPQVALLKREFDDATAAVEQTERHARQLQQDEQRALDEAQQAEATQGVLRDLLDQLDRIDRARARAGGSVVKKPQSDRS